MARTLSKEAERIAPDYSDEHEAPLAYKKLEDV
jgi:hypothetical protein